MSTTLIIIAAVVTSTWIGFRLGIWLTRKDYGAILAHLVETGKLDPDVLEHPENHVP